MVVNSLTELIAFKHGSHDQKTHGHRVEARPNAAVREKSSYSDGFDAYQQNQPRRANPYVLESRENSKGWLRGWFDAKNNRRRANKSDVLDDLVAFKHNTPNSPHSEHGKRAAQTRAFAFGQRQGANPYRRTSTASLNRRLRLFAKRPSLGKLFNRGYDSRANAGSPSPLGKSVKPRKVSARRRHLIESDFAEKIYSGPRKGRKGSQGGSMPRSAGTSDPVEYHRQRVAQQTRNMPSAMRGVMGNYGMEGASAGTDRRKDPEYSTLMSASQSLARNFVHEDPAYKWFNASDAEIGRKNKIAEFFYDKILPIYRSKKGAGKMWLQRQTFAATQGKPHQLSDIYREANAKFFSE